MNEIGKVIFAEENTLTVSMKSHAACKGCKICVRGENGEMTAKVTNSCDAEAGDYVEIEVDEGVIAKAAGLAYGIPLLAMLGGFAAGYSLGGELVAFLGGIVAVFAAFLAIKLFDKRRNQHKYMPKAVRKVSAELIEQLINPHED